MLYYYEFNYYIQVIYRQKSQTIFILELPTCETFKLFQDQLQI